MRELFEQHYRGCRYSFGYPACPNLADQEILLDLLQAQRIGVRMSEEFQLWPSAVDLGAGVPPPGGETF